MKKQLIVALGILALVFSLGGPAGAVLNFADDDCGNPDTTIDTPAEAARVANGYNCAGVDLTITTSLNDNAPSDIVDQNLQISAKSLTITGPLEIINDVALSSIRLVAEGGNIKITDAIIKAKDLLRLECKGVLCTIDVDDSELVASFDFSLTGSSTGDLLIIANGPINIKNTTTWGAALLHITSKSGSITWFCPGAGGCKDPNLSKPDIITSQCGDPIVFPCTATFDNSKELKEVCFPGVTCGGGAKEIGVRAKGDIDVSGSTIKALDHISFVSTEGQFKGKKSTLTAPDNLTISVKGPIDISEATITSGNALNITAGSGCPAAPAVCINGRKSDLEGDNITIRANNALGVIDLCEASVDDLGADLPTLNGDSTSPFDPNVLDTAAECAPAGAASIS